MKIKNNIWWDYGLEYFLYLQLENYISLLYLNFIVNNLKIYKPVWLTFFSDTKYSPVPL